MSPKGSSRLIVFVFTCFNSANFLTNIIYYTIIVNTNNKYINSNHPLHFIFLDRALTETPAVLISTSLA